MNDEATVKDSRNEVVTVAPAEIAFRYVRWECPDGTYHFLGDGWAVEVKRRDGLLLPKKFGGDLARLRALLPDISPESN